MDTVHFFVQIQLVVTVFLVALLWSLHNRLHRQEFFRLWAWAWTAFGVFLGLAVLSQYLPPQMLSIKKLVVLAAVEAGFLQIPLLVFGAWSLKTRKIGSKRTLRLGVGLALAAGAASFVVSRLTSPSVLASFCIRSTPRTLALAVALLFCAWVFFREWRAGRSWAAAITGGCCALYAIDQGLYSAAFINYLAFQQRAPAFADVTMLLQRRWLFLDVFYICGICLGLVLLLLEEHERTEATLQKTSVTADLIAKSNVALRGEITERKRIEEALRHSEEQYRRVVDHLHDALMIDDATGHVVFASDRFLQLFGIDRKELNTINLEDYVAPEWRGRLRDCHDRRVRGEHVPERFEYEGVRRDGQRLWLEVNVVPIRDSAGKVTHTQSAIRDITDRKRAAEALQASEERYRHLVESGHDWVWEVDANAVYTHVGPQCREIIGYEPKEIIGRTPFDLMPPEEARRVAAVFGPIAAERKPFRRLENVNLHKNGHKVTLETNGVPVVNQEGNFLGYRGMDRDITERKRADEARSRLAAIVESSDDAIISEGLDGVILTWNAGAHRIFGYTEAEAVGKQITMLIPPDLRYEENEILQRAIAGEGTQHYETIRVTKGGIRINVSLTVSPLRDATGKIVGASKIARDVTEHKQIEDRLRESQRRLEAIVASGMDAIIAADEEQRILLFNTAAERMFRCSAQEAIGGSIDRFIPERFRAEHNMHIRRFAEAGTTNRAMNSQGILWALRANGEEFPIEASISCVSVGSKKLFTVIIRDVTEHRRAEQAVRESEERFRLVANTAPVLIWMSGPDKLCNYFNRPWLEFTGRPIEAELGNGWSKGVHPEDLKSCLDTYGQAFDRHERLKMEYRLRRNDGEYRWVLDIGVPRFDPDGSFLGYIGSCIDVTHHKLAEEALSSVSRRLIEAQEEERTRIARELHDDINQRIAFLAMEVAQLEQNPQESTFQFRRRIEEAQKHIADLGNDIQALSHRLHSSKLDYLGLTAAARSFCKEFSEQQKVEIEFSSENIPRHLPREMSLCLFRVLQEALHNAVKHGEARQVRVELRGATDEIELIVNDSGVGFDPELAMSGRGLGIISMQERLHLLNGRLLIESKPNHGTMIRACVPFTSEIASMGAAG